MRINTPTTFDPRPTFPSTVNKSMKWRLWHGLNFMNGGLTFLCGSYMYYPYELKAFRGDIIGAWLFTIGSATFLLADLTEWNHFKTGCCSGSEYEGPHSFWRTLKRMEIGLNFFASVIGSLLYLLIPLLVGNYFFWWDHQ